MRNYKFSLFAFTFIYLGLSSCSKIAERNINTVQTTTQDIIIGSNTIPLSAAIKTGLNFLQQKNTTTTVSLKSAETVVKNGKPYFHIINANKGFVILSPDSAYVPVLAYDSTHNFSFAEKDLNWGLKQWFNKHSIEIDFIRNTHNRYTDSIGIVNKFLWNVLGGVIKKGEKSELAAKSENRSAIINRAAPTLISVEPAYYSTNSTVGSLCLTNWYQNNPYNKFCPWISGYQAPTGCVPMAMAQLMAFWKFPVTYYWNTMAPYVSMPWMSNYISVYNPALHPENFVEAARLLHDIGTTQLQGFSNPQFATYGSDATSADLGASPLVFKIFGYTSGGTFAGYAGQSTPLFYGPGENLNTDLIVNEISNNKRPCLLDGWPSEGGGAFGIFYATGSGHSWVADGTNISTFYSGHTYTYNDGLPELASVGVHGITSYTLYDNVYVYSMVHMNWGWNGNDFVNDPLLNNGWYDLSSYTQASAASPNYKYFQQVIYNIHP